MNDWTGKNCTIFWLITIKRKDTRTHSNNKNILARHGNKNKEQAQSASLWYSVHWTGPFSTHYVRWEKWQSANERSTTCNVIGADAAVAVAIAITTKNPIELAVCACSSSVTMCNKQFVFKINDRFISPHYIIRFLRARRSIHTHKFVLL